MVERSAGMERQMDPGEGLSPDWAAARALLKLLFPLMGRWPVRSWRRMQPSE